MLALCGLERVRCKQELTTCNAAPGANRMCTQAKALRARLPITVFYFLGKLLDTVVVIFFALLKVRNLFLVFESSIQLVTQFIGAVTVSN